MNGATVKLLQSPSFSASTVFNVPSGSLDVRSGGLTIPGGTRVTISNSINVIGSMSVTGTMKHSSGTWVVSDQLDWWTSGDLPRATTCKSLVIRSGKTVSAYTDIKATTVDIYGTLFMRGGEVDVDGSLTVHETGKITHIDTSSTSQTIRLNVGKDLVLKKGAVLDATKSSTKTTGSTSWPYASHGGKAKSSLTQGEYDSATNPVRSFLSFSVVGLFPLEEARFVLAIFGRSCVPH